MIERLKKPKGGKSGEKTDDQEGAGEKDGADEANSAVTEHLDRLEKLIQEMNERLKTIETRLPPKK